MAHSVELSLQVDCWADAHSSVLQLMMLQTLSSACLQIAATLQIPHWSEKFGKTGLTSCMYGTTVGIIIYQIVSQFSFSWHSTLFTFIDSLKLPETFIGRHVILHVLSLCILFTIITFVVNGSKFFSQSLSFEMCVSLTAISQKQ